MHHSEGLRVPLSQMHMKPRLFTIIAALLLSIVTFAQDHTDANIFGDVQCQGEHIPFANVYIEGTKIGTTTDPTGHYMLIDLPEGEYTIIANAMGYQPQKKIYRGRGRKNT